MGLTKQYLRWAPAGNFNIVASARCNIVFVCVDGQEGRFVAVAGCEHIFIWDLRLGEKHQVLLGEKTEVTFLCASPDNIHLAAGYADGKIHVFNLKSGDLATVYSGHKSAISTLCYDESGHRLASGSIDNEIIVWDILAEAGLCRLSGHKGIVTQVKFMKDFNILISSSKDTYVKFWDLETKRCFKTLTGHRTEIWAMTLMQDDKYLITGSIDSQLTVWKISKKDEQNGIENSMQYLSLELDQEDMEAEDNTCPLICIKIGAIMRSSKGRVVSLIANKTGKILACHGVDSTIDTFYFCDIEEAEKRLKKRKKNQIKKMAKNSNEEMDTEDKESEETLIELGLRDEIKKLSSLKVDYKIKSIDIVLGRAGELRTAIIQANNTITMYRSNITEKQSEPSILRSISTLGHHSEVRAVCFSSDNLAIASGSAESVKIWNRPSQLCLQTIETGYVLSLCFVPGDRHLLIGLKSGSLLIADIAAGDVLEEISAHSKELWSITLLPNMRGPVTGGGDNTVKIWNFELIQSENQNINESKAKVLSLLHTRTLKLEESVLCVKISPNGKFIAVALLDSTVKMFFLDSFKFYISLYGHKLPVLCMDISSDSNLIATGSADRNIKIWGIDFGDCHRSIFAHDDSVTGLQFVYGTHQFFTSGKDGKIKHWDGDTFDKIATLPQGHIGESHGIAVSPSGAYLVSSGSDKVIRLYQRTDETLVLQDAAEEERQAEEDATLATGEETVVQGLPGLNLPSKKTVGSERGAESILECLEISAAYQLELNEHDLIIKKSGKSVPPPQPPPLMLAYNVHTPQEFLLDTIKRIRASDLIETLLILPFSAVIEILKMLPSMFNGTDIELLCKVTIFLIRIHNAPIVANQTLLPTIRKLEKKLMKCTCDLRDVIGYNLHGLQYIQREIENSEGVLLFRDATKEKNTRTKKLRQRERAKRAFLTLNT